MRRYICLLVLLIALISDRNYAQPLTRNFSYQLDNARIYSSTTLSNGDYITFDVAYPDINTHHTYSTGLPNIPYMHCLSGYSSRGVLKWYTLIYAPGFLFNASITADANDNIYFSTAFDDSVVFDIGGVNQVVMPPNADDILFAKFDGGGVFQWAKSIGGTGNDVVYDLIVLPAGNIAITGAFINTVDFDPGPGTVNLTSTVYSSFVVQYNSNGDYVDLIPFMQTGNSQLQIRAIRRDNNNNYYLYCTISDTVDFDPGPGVFNLVQTYGLNAAVVKYDSTWQVIWGYGFGNVDGINEFIFDNTGRLIITGDHQATTDFDISGNIVTLGYNGTFIARYDTSFNLVSVVGVDPASTNYAKYVSVITDFQDNIIAVGKFNGTIDVDPGPIVQNLTSYPTGIDYDSFLIRYDNLGQLQSVDHFGDAGTQEINQLFRAGNNIWLAGLFQNSIDVELGPGIWLHEKVNGGYSTIIANYYLCSPSYDTISATICKGSHFVFANDTLTEEGKYTRYFTNVTGCDSIVVLNLHLTYINNGITLRDSVFYADEPLAQYQWINCKTQVIVPGATGSTYVAPDNSEYSVMVMKNGCSSETACLNRYENSNDNLPDLHWAYKTDLYLSGYSTDHMSIDYDQNLVIGGEFDGLVDFDFTPGEAFINAHDLNDLALPVYHPDGNFKTAFASGYYGSTSEVILGVVTDKQNNTIAIGNYSSGYDINPDTGIAMLPATSGFGLFMIKLNSLSQLQWAIGIPGMSGFRATSISNDGSYLICGNFSSPFDIDPGPAVLNLPYSSVNDNIYVSKFSSSGQLLMAFSIFNNATFGDVNISTCTFDNLGNIIIGGEYVENTDFDPGPGTYILTSSGSVRSFVAKYSPTGQFIWAKSKTSGFGSLDCDYDNNIFAGFSGAQVIEKYNSSGTLITSLPIPAGLDLELLEIDNIGDLNVTFGIIGSVILSGHPFYSPNFQRSLISRFDNDLSYKWAFLLDCDCDLRELRVDQEQNVFIYGYLWSACDFDPGPDSLILTSTGLGHFVARYGYSCITPTTILGNLNFCQGDSTIISAGQGYASYLWSTGESSQSIIVNQPGLYYVDVTSNLGCVYRDSVYIGMISAPVPTISVSSSTQICQGDSVLITATPGLSNYQWQRNSVNIIGANSQNYFAKNAGVYKCVVADSGCSRESNNISVRIVCYPIGPNQQKDRSEANDDFDFVALPNPAQEHFRIISKCGESSTTNLIIYDSSYREVRKLSNYKGNYEIIVDGLEPGMYYCKLNCDLGTKTIKVILLE